jgi:hypothetical protein
MKQMDAKNMIKFGSLVMMIRIFGYHLNGKDWRNTDGKSLFNAMKKMVW